VPIHASPPRPARRAVRVLVAATTIAGLSLVAPFFVKAASASESQLSETGWTASSNTSYSAGDAPQNAISGDTGARFSSDADQAAGMTFEVNMGSAQTFNQIEMDAGGYPGDYARGYNVEVSSNGSTWTTVYSGTGTSSPETATFATQTDQYIEVVLTAAVTTNWWSIVNFTVYAPVNGLTVTASTYAAASSGVATEATSDTGGGDDVGYIGNGAWLEYTGVNFGSGLTGQVVARLASATAGTGIGTISFRIGSTTATPFATITVNGTGGWQTWVSSTPVTASPVPSGTQTLYVTFTTSTGANFVNVNWFQFT
jgi:hypothetical protein